MAGALAGSAVFGSADSSCGRASRAPPSALHGGYKGKGGEIPLHIHFELDDIHAEVKRLKARGVKFLGPVRKQPYNAYETTFVDPDGNRFGMV